MGVVGGKETKHSGVGWLVECSELRKLQRTTSEKEPRAGDVAQW